MESHMISFWSGECSCSERERERRIVGTGEAEYRRSTFREIDRIGIVGQMTFQGAAQPIMQYI